MIAQLTRPDKHGNRVESRGGGRDLPGKKTTRITIETQQVWVLHKAVRTTRQWCGVCRAEVDWVDVQSAGEYAHLALSTVQKWLGAGELHSKRAESGSPLVCLNSLRRSVARLVEGSKSKNDFTEGELL